MKVNTCPKHATNIKELKEKLNLLAWGDVVEQKHCPRRKMAGSSSEP